MRQNMARHWSDCVQSRWKLVLVDMYYINRYDINGVHKNPVTGLFDRKSINIEHNNGELRIFLNITLTHVLHGTDKSIIYSPTQLYVILKLFSNIYLRHKSGNNFFQWKICFDLTEIKTKS